MTEQLHSIGLAARNAEKTRQREHLTVRPERRDEVGPYRTQADIDHNNAAREAANEERNRQNEVMTAEHNERLEARGFLKDGKPVPDPHPGRVTKWHQRADSRLTPLVPVFNDLWAAAFQLCGRRVLLIPVDPLPNGRIPCADCGQPARFTVIEQASLKSVRGWQWCGVCQVG
jgi:hypothetical protein